MVNRPAGAEEPDDSGHVRGLRDAGAVTYRGSATHRRGGPRQRDPRRHDPRAGRDQRRRRGRLVLAAAADRGHRRHPDLDQSRGDPRPASCRPACSSSAAARPAASWPRSTPGSACPPRSSSPARAWRRPTIRATPRRSGRRSSATAWSSAPGVRALRARAGAGTNGAHLIELDDGSTAEGHAILLAVGRAFPIDDLGLEHYGIDTSGRTPFPRDGRLRIADGLWVIGDPAGPELHTHQGHYQGELAVRMALGEAVVPDYRALPRATYTDPEAAFVGLSLDGRQGGRPRRLRAGRRLREERQGLRRPGQARARDDRGRSSQPRAGGRRDRLPGRLGRDPRVRPGDQGHGSRWTSWPRRSTPSRPRRASSTACSPTPCASWRRRVAGLAGRRSASRAPRSGPAGSGLEDDPPVHHDQRRAGRRQRAARLDRLAQRGRRDDHQVGPLADRQPAAVGLAGRRPRGRRTRRGAPGRGSAPRPAR